jgi:hypothetical protein
VSIINAPTFSEAVYMLIDARLLDTHTCMPGEVQSYDATKQTADIKPLLMARVLNREGDFVNSQLPVFSNVPVIFSSGGGFRSTYPLAAGDVVEVRFTESSIERWQTLGGVQTTDGRRFHIADAICTPGLHDDTKPWTGASTSKATWGKDGAPQLIATSSGLELGATDTDVATEAVILGTTYRAHEDTFFSALVNALTGAANGLTAAIPGLTAAGAAATPAAPGMATAVGGLTAAALALNAAATALTSFSSATASYVSNKVKTK